MRPFSIQRNTDVGEELLAAFVCPYRAGAYGRLRIIPSLTLRDDSILFPPCTHFNTRPPRNSRQATRVSTLSRTLLGRLSGAVSRRQSNNTIPSNTPPMAKTTCGDQSHTIPHAAHAYKQRRTFFSMTRCASGSSKACLKVTPSTRSKAHCFRQVAVASRFSGRRLPRTWKGRRAEVDTKKRGAAW